MTVDGPDQAFAVQLDSDNELRCRQLAADLQLPLTDDDSASYTYLLIYTEQGLALQRTDSKAAGPVMVDFVSGVASYRRAKGGGELIVKAVAGDKQPRPTVLDATAGLGRDSFVLASWGYPVTLCERSPIVACLLDDGLQRASQAGDSALQAVIARMQLQPIDAVSYLQQLEQSTWPDVVLIDPMFPPSKKSALVKKEMQVFQQIIGADQDSELLLNAALEYANNRVVVKRPRKSQFLTDKKPNFSVEGKAIRFDIYTKKAFGK
ncbi:MAG: class I SAM-dependent methyltransferase [Pseudomonadales bacterium]